MSHSRLWSSFEAKPAGGDNANEGDDEIRNTKVDIRERMVVDHEWNVSTAADGRHLQCTLKASAADLAAIADYGRLYTKLVGDHIELFFIDEDGQITQLTSSGELNLGELTINLDDIDDVSATTPALRDGIYFDTADSTWKKGQPHAVYA